MIVVFECVHILSDFCSLIHLHNPKLAENTDAQLDSLLEGLGKHPDSLVMLIFL